MVDFSLELSLGGVVAGLDEAGRGPWAGPVVAAAVIFTQCKAPDGIRDSKQMPKPEREQAFVEILQCALVGIGQASVAEIDRINILQASLLAMRRAFKQLPCKPHYAIVDGNFAPKRLGCKTHTVIKGDCTSYSIAAAGIVAKVTRDRIMAELAAEFPGYGWETNAGYGTEAHQRGIAQRGVCKYHRTSFTPIRIALGQAA